MFSKTMMYLFIVIICGLFWGLLFHQIFHLQFIIVAAIVSWVLMILVGFSAAA